MQPDESQMHLWSVARSQFWFRAAVALTDAGFVFQSQGYRAVDADYQIATLNMESISVSYAVGMKAIIHLVLSRTPVDFEQPDGENTVRGSAYLRHIDETRRPIFLNTLAKREGYDLGRLELVDDSYGTSVQEMRSLLDPYLNYIHMRCGAMLNLEEWRDDLVPYWDSM